MPSQEDRLILQLDLGGGGQDYSSINPGLRCNGRKRQTCPLPCRENERICQNLANQGRLHVYIHVVRPSSMVISLTTTCGCTLQPSSTA